MEIINEFYDLLEELDDNQWDRKLNSKWTIKDCVAHLVGWEREAVKRLREEWETGEKPWFLIDEDFDEFNKKSVEEFKGYNSKDLIKEWKYWQKKLDEEIKKIGERNLKAEPEMFGWVFDETGDSHYLYHLKQIKKVLKR